MALSKKTHAYIASALDISAASVVQHLRDPLFPHSNHWLTKRQIAEIKKWQRQYLKNDFFSREEYEAAWVKRLALIKKRLLQLPTIISPKLATAKTELELKQILLAALRKAMLP